MIQSAHDLVKAILVNWDEAETPIEDSCDMVSSRDRAIIERTIDECKYILRCDAETLGGNGMEQKSKGLIRGALLIEEAIDSVLRELSE